MVEPVAQELCLCVVDIGGFDSKIRIRARSINRTNEGMNERLSVYFNARAVVRETRLFLLFSSLSHDNNNNEKYLLDEERRSK